jgi:hypothetical protein
MPPEGPKRQVVQVRGDHGLKADTDAVAVAIGAWLPMAIRHAGRPAARTRRAAPA